MKKSSIWLEGVKYKKCSRLQNDIDVDVLVIGGGITGLSTAFHLIDSGLKVCLVEKNQLFHGVTSRTTGKLTYLQELIYTDLKKTYSDDISKLYLDSQKSAIKIVNDIIENNNIECDYEKVTSFVFTNDENKVDNIKKEKELLRAFNIEVEENYKLPDNYNIKYGISVEDTYVFNPIKYLINIKKICEDKGILIYENTKVVDIDKKDLYICKTENNIIKAKYVVLAMHYPYFLFPFLLPLKTHLEKSYILAYETDKNLYFSAITSQNPTLSMRYLNLDDKTYKICLSNSHNLAFKNNDSENFKSLINKVKKQPNFIWSNKDIITSDKLPLIGEIDYNLFLATGYNTWGMTNGSLAGKIISDLIKGIENDYVDLFNPKRGINKNSIISFPINIVSTIKSFVGTKINKNKSWYDKRIKFENRNGKNIAIYTDDNNKEHIVYNKCPHLKCSLIFNEEEKTWDCPCHGSRFDIDGKCIEGPSNYDISYK